MKLRYIEVPFMICGYVSQNSKWVAANKSFGIALLESV